MNDFIEKIPKAELHLHIEGSLEPELMFKLAKRNGIKIPYENIEDIKKAYNFTNLQSFLDIYYAGANVLVEKQDFYDLTWEYILKCKENNIIHTEIFFDPQTHTQRGIAFETVVNGINEALLDAKKEFGISSEIIMCFLRHLTQEEAFEVLELSLAHKDKIIAVGLDSSEIGNPPVKFEEVFGKAKECGYRIVVHAGEEGGISYIEEALDLLKAERIDHGVQAIHSEYLMQRLKKEQIPLTVCPNSNIELKVFDTYKEHNIKKLLDYGLNVCVNSDDPAYFKGYLNKNYLNIYENLNLCKEDIITLAKNSFKASFCDEKTKENYINMIDNFVQEHK